MDATNQAPEGIKGQYVGNVFGGLSRGKCGETRRGGRWGYRDLSSAIGLVSDTAPQGHNPLL